MTSFDATTHQRDFFDVLGRTEFADAGARCDFQGWIDRCVALLSDVRERRARVFLVGNGASQAMSSHYAADLTKNALVPALPLSDAAMLTCFSNDYSYEDAYREMLKRHLHAGDVLIGISSSGASKNILNAAGFALSSGAKLISLSGFRPDNPLRRMPGLSAFIPSAAYGQVECGHAYLMHAVLDALCVRRGSTPAAQSE